MWFMMKLKGLKFELHNWNKQNTWDLSFLEINEWDNLSHLPSMIRLRNLNDYWPWPWPFDPYHFFNKRHQKDDHSSKISDPNLPLPFA